MRGIAVEIGGEQTDEHRTVANGARALGIELDTARVTQLLALARLIRRWNTVVNLVSRADLDRLVPRHLLDSLAFLPHLTGRLVADLGSGAGLPGLPLAIASPRSEITLIERRERRARFMRQATIELRLRNVRVVTDDLSRFRPERLFDTVVARALARPGEAWQLGRPLLAVGGRMVIACAAGAGADIEDARVARHPVSVPGLERPRELLVLVPAGA